MLAANDVGLDTCAQAAWRHYHDIIRSLLSLPDNEIVVCGMSLGYADQRRARKSACDGREPVEGFATFIDTIDSEIPATGVKHASV